MTKSIPLTQGKVALVSDEDYDYLLAVGSWSFGRSTGHALHFGLHDDGHRTTISQHRLVMSRVLGHPVPPELVVDHIDRNRLNNTRENLRIATKSQNQANRSLGLSSLTGFKGVTVDGNRFRVRITFNRGKRLHLGQYNDAELAARMFDSAARLFHARFAGVNYPDKTTTPETLAILRRYIAANPAAMDYLRRRGRLGEIGLE